MPHAFILAVLVGNDSNLHELGEPLRHDTTRQPPGYQKFKRFAEASIMAN